MQRSGSIISARGSTRPIYVVSWRLDSTRQTSSPYTFVCNNPIMMTDPTGNSSRSKRIGTEVGIGLAMAVVTAIGFALSLFSLGTSDEAAAGLDAELLANEAVVSVDWSTLTVTTPLVTSRVAAGLINVGWQIMANTAFSIGTSSLQYEIQAGSNFNMKGFKQAVEEGAVSGAVFGVLSGANVVSGKLLDKFIPCAWLRMPVKVVVNSIAGAASSVTAQALMDAIENTHSYQNLWLATGVGAIEGIPFGLGDIGTAPEDRAAIRESPGKIASAGRSAASSVGQGVGRAYQEVTLSLRGAAENAEQARLFLSELRLAGYGSLNS